MRSEEDEVEDAEEGSTDGSLLSGQNSPDRRCSARLLSKSVALTLRQLQRDEHTARVAQLVRSNERFYRRQQLCESITVIILLGSFTGFSIYLVLAHGFQYFHASNFTMLYHSPANLSTEGKQVELICRADQKWEWCRWVHMDSFCEWEWISPSMGVEKIGCNMKNIELIGNYSLHECGLRFTVRSHHEGDWLCEVEKYHPGFSRRYGEVLYAQMTLSVIELYTEQKTSTLPTTTEVTNNFTTATATSLINDREQREQEVYESQFFILKIVVRSAVVLTLLSLVGVFGVMFFHSWRAWDQNTVKPVKILEDSNNDVGSNEVEYPEMDPMLMRRILQTRRKSVAFSVCVLDRENMTFELDRKKVQLSSTDRITPSSFCPLPTLKEDCEHERVTLPLSLSTRHKIQMQSFNRARRMSMPPGPLTQVILDGVEGKESNILKIKKFGDSIETIM